MSPDTVSPNSETNPPAVAPRGRLQYAVTPIIEYARDNARDMNTQLEDVLTTVMAALADDGVIDQDEATGILEQLLKTDRANTGTLHTLDLLLQAGVEPAQRELERNQAKRRNGVKKS